MKAFDLVDKLADLVDNVEDEVLLLDGPMDFELVKSEDGRIYIKEKAYEAESEEV